MAHGRCTDTLIAVARYRNIDINRGGSRHISAIKIRLALLGSGSFPVSSEGAIPGDRNICTALAGSGSFPV